MTVFFAWALSARSGGPSFSDQALFHKGMLRGERTSSTGTIRGGDRYPISSAVADLAPLSERPAGVSAQPLSVQLPRP